MAELLIIALVTVQAWTGQPEARPGWYPGRPSGWPSLLNIWECATSLDRGWQEFCSREASFRGDASDQPLILGEKVRLNSRLACRVASCECA
jgi:hypothetical protein